MKHDRTEDYRRSRSAIGWRTIGLSALIAAGAVMSGAVIPSHAGQASATANANATASANAAASAKASATATATATTDVGNSQGSTPTTGSTPPGDAGTTTPGSTMPGDPGQPSGTGVGADTSAAANAGSAGQAGTPPTPGICSASANAISTVTNADGTTKTIQDHKSDTAQGPGCSSNANADAKASIGGSAEEGTSN